MFVDCLKIKVVVISLFIVFDNLLINVFCSSFYMYQTNDRIREIGFCKSIFVLM